MSDLTDRMPADQVREALIADILAGIVNEPQTLAREILAALAAWNTRAAPQQGEVTQAAIDRFKYEHRNACYPYATDFEAREAVEQILLVAVTPPPSGDAEDFQTGVDRWMDACFGDAIKADRLERADRFIEEALELCQTEPSFTKDRAHALVDYVFDRPQGEINQEVGGVMVTLAAFCNTFGVRMDEAAATELARVWTKVEQIRAKQAAKPTGSALPIAALSVPATPARGEGE